MTEPVDILLQQQYPHVTLTDRSTLPDMIIYEFGENLSQIVPWVIIMILSEI